MPILTKIRVKLEDRQDTLDGRTQVTSIAEVLEPYLPVLLQFVKIILAALDPVGFEQQMDL